MQLHIQNPVRRHIHLHRRQTWHPSSSPRRRKPRHKPHHPPNRTNHQSSHHSCSYTKNPTRSINRLRCLLWPCVQLPKSGTLGSIRHTVDHKLKANELQRQPIRSVLHQFSNPNCLRLLWSRSPRNPLHHHARIRRERASREHEQRRRKHRHHASVQRLEFQSFGFAGQYFVYGERWDNGDYEWTRVVAGVSRGGELVCGVQEV